MKETKKVVLSFEKDTVYKPSLIASKLLKKFPHLGNEVILPIDMNNDGQIPFLCFQQNKDFKIYSNFYYMSVELTRNCKDKIDKIINEIFKIFNDLDIDFIGVAYTYEEELKPDKIDNLKKKNLKSYNDNEEICINYLTYFDFEKFNEIRCLEGYSTFDKQMLLHFEFNTKLISDLKINCNDFHKVYEKFNRLIEEKKKIRM